MFDSGKTSIVVGEDARPIRKDLDTILTAARAQRAGVGQLPLAYHDPSYYGGISAVQVHHVIPVKVADDFEKLFNGIKDTSDGLLVFDQNHVDNLAYLPAGPNAATAIQTAERKGIYAVQHQGPHQAYSDMVARLLQDIQDDFDAATTAAENDPKLRLKAAEDAARRVEFMTHGLLKAWSRTTAANGASFSRGLIRPTSTTMSETRSTPARFAIQKGR